MQHLAALSRQPVQEVGQGVQNRFMNVCNVCVLSLSSQRLQTYERDVSSLQRDIEQLSDKIQVSKKKAAGNTYTEIQAHAFFFSTFLTHMIKMQCMYVFSL